MTRSPEEREIRIEITEEQRKQIHQVTGKKVCVLKLEPLEERVAPKIALN